MSYAQANLKMDGPTVGYYVAACGVLGVAFLLSFKQLGRLFDDVELILYGIGVMVLSCLLMVRKFSEDIIGDDDHDVDAFAAWLTAIVGMYGIGYPIGHTAVIGWFSKAMKHRPQGHAHGPLRVGGVGRAHRLPDLLGRRVAPLGVDGSSRAWRRCSARRSSFWW